MTPIPIWQRTTHTIYNAQDTEPYSIQLDGKTIYEGIAVPNPQTGNVVIEMNGICAQYLAQEISGYVDNYVRTFKLIAGGIEKEYTFAYNWGYGEGSTFGSVANVPITGEVFVGETMYLTRSDNTETYKIQCVAKDGVLVETIDVDPVGVGGSNYNYEYSIPEGTDRVIVFLVDGASQFLFAYDVIPCEPKFQVTYVNAIGGIDTMLFAEGEQIDSYERKTIRTGGNEQSVINYHTNIVKRYELHTGKLTGEAGRRMHHLLSTTTAELYDKASSRIYPVNIVSSECRYKTYHNNGNTLYDYTIVVEVAQERERR